MLVWFIRQLLFLRKFRETSLTPHHVALACTLGMILGLLPKGNLLALSMTAVILSFRVNLGVVMASILAFSLIGGRLDAFTSPIGVFLLSHGAWQEAWKQFYALPFVPWFSLNNSVVLGSFVTGWTAAVPLYALTYFVARLWREWRGTEDPEAGETIRMAPTDSASDVQQAA